MQKEEGIVKIPSRRSVDETVDKLKAILQSRGVTLFALVDHSGEAEKVGLKMPPTRLLIFEAARQAFKDPFALDWFDESEDYGEDRFAVIGMAENRLLFVACTMRGESIRMISARLAGPFERRQYHEENKE